MISSFTTGLPAATSATALDQVVVRLRVLGSMEAWTVNGLNVLPIGRKTRALLAMIAMAAPRPVSRARLAGHLWSRGSEEQARASLRQEIHRLTDALSPMKTEVLIVNRDNLSLQPGTVWIDIDEVMRATAAQPAALSLLDAELLEDLDGLDPNFDAWLQTEREALRNRSLRIAEAMLQDVLDPNAAITAAQRLLTIDRSHEGAWRALMRAHVGRGERGLAIQAYERCRAALADVLDVAPSVETQKLLAEIRGPSHRHLPLRPSRPVEAATPMFAKVALDQEPQRPLEPRQHEPARKHHGAHIGVSSIRFVGIPHDPAHLALSLTDEIVDALSRFRGMFTVSSTSLDPHAAEQREAAQRTSGVDYLLDGSIQRTRNKIRVSLQLADLQANMQIVWARRYDRAINDLTPIEDEIAAEAAAQIGQDILLIEAERSSTRAAVDATAYDHMLRSIPLIGRMDHASFMRAGQHLADAIVLEPDYAAAQAWYAYWHIFLVGQGWTDQPKAMMEKAGELAERATVLDPFDARGWSINGHVRGFLHRRLREAVVLHERALALNPNLALAWALSAVTRAYAGDPAEAERRYHRYKTLSPLDPHAFFFDAFFVLIRLMQRDYKAAVQAGRVVSQLNPSFSAGYKPYLSALGHLQRNQEATTVRARLMALEPDFTIEQFLQTTPIERESDLTHYAEGLRLAGVRERAQANSRYGDRNHGRSGAVSRLQDGSGFTDAGP